MRIFDEIWLVIVGGTIVGTLGIPLGFLVRRIWHRCFTEYDRSMLIRLEIGQGKMHHPKMFSNTPVIVGTFPFQIFD